MQVSAPTLRFLVFQLALSGAVGFFQGLTGLNKGSIISALMRRRMIEMGRIPPPLPQVDISPMDYKKVVDANRGMDHYDKEITTRWKAESDDETEEGSEAEEEASSANGTELVLEQAPPPLAALRLPRKASKHGPGVVAADWKDIPEYTSANDTESSPEVATQDATGSAPEDIAGGVEPASEANAQGAPADGAQADSEENAQPDAPQAASDGAEHSAQVGPDGAEPLAGAAADSADADGPEGAPEGAAQEASEDAANGTESSVPAELQEAYEKGVEAASEEGTFITFDDNPEGQQ